MKKAIGEEQIIVCVSNVALLPMPLAVSNVAFFWFGKPIAPFPLEIRKG